MLPDEQFTRYAQEYMDMVFRVAFNYLKSRADADDITQNVLLKLYHADKPFESDDHMKHWLIRVTINECKKWMIAPWRRTEPLEDYAATLPFPATEHSDLFFEVMGLPKKYRMVIFLYYYEDYSTEEISRLLKIPKATVCTHLKRGRERLKTTLLLEAMGNV